MTSRGLLARLHCMTMNPTDDRNGADAALIDDSGPEQHAGDAWRDQPLIEVATVLTEEDLASLDRVAAAQVIAAIGEGPKAMISAAIVLEQASPEIATKLRVAAASASLQVFSLARALLEPLDVEGRVPRHALDVVRDLLGHLVDEMHVAVCRAEGCDACREVTLQRTLVERAYSGLRGARDNVGLGPDRIDVASIVEAFARPFAAASGSEREEVASSMVWQLVREFPEEADKLMRLDDSDRRAALVAWMTSLGTRRARRGEPRGVSGVAARMLASVGAMGVSDDTIEETAKAIDAGLRRREVRSRPLTPR